jgi:8-oxo-dGTP diphosphatase
VSIKTPLLAADTVIRIGPADRIVLIRRKNPPFGWALPGGFVEIGETVETAAIREAREETSLAVTLVGLLGVYSDPERDPRGHTVSIVYMATASGSPEGADDAAEARVFNLDDLPADLAFDHDRILSDYRAVIRGEQ